MDAASLWVGRDPDGEIWVFDNCEPELAHDHFRCPTAGCCDEIMRLPSRLLPELPRGYKQQVQVTVTPLGPAVKGGES